MNILSNKEIENMNAHDRKIYYESMREELSSKKSTIKDKSILRSSINLILPYIRNYDFVMNGLENIPLNSNCLFVMNHSNSHDFMTMQEMMKNLGINYSFIASNEGLNNIILTIFKSCGALPFNRFDKIGAHSAFLEMTGDLVNGEYGAMFPEGTWNLHPYKPMHLIKTGAAYAASIAGIPIVPVTFEYIEVDNLCEKEKDLFTKCVIDFGKPIIPSSQYDLFQLTDIIQKAFEDMRRKNWIKYNIKKSNFDDNDIYRYLNHTYLKKFGGAAIYDSVREGKVLFVKDSLSSENDYHLDENSMFVPGSLTINEGKKYILKKSL